MLLSSSWTRSKQMSVKAQVSCPHSHPHRASPMHQVQPRYVTPPCRTGLTKAEQEGAQSCVLLKAALFLRPPLKAIEVNERFFVASSRLERRPFSSAASCLGNNPGVVHGGIIKASF